MKLKTLTISIVTGLGIALAANAPGEVLQTLTFSLVTYTQRPINDNGTNATAATPKVQVHSTSELLSALAKDKAAQGSWGSNSFPAAAKLAAGNNGFVVIAGTNILVDVSDIISFTNGATKIFSGKQNDSTGLASPATTEIQIGRITFDDTAIEGGTGLQFYIQGVLTQTRTDTAPVNNVYTSTRSARLTNVTGEGSDSSGTAFILTGSVTAAGHAKQTVPQ